MTNAPPLNDRACEEGDADGGGRGSSVLMVAAVAVVLLLAEASLSALPAAISITILVPLLSS